MYDYSAFAKGSVYDIVDSNGVPLNKLYMVVSSTQFNAMGNNVFVVMIDEPISNAKADMYHVSFDIMSNGVRTPMHIYPEVLFSITKKRIAKYKFTLSPEIQKQVDQKIMQLIVSEPMYSLNEAIVELHNIEMNKRVSAVTSCEVNADMMSVEEDTSADDIDYEDTQLNTEDAQRLFAIKMKKEISPVTDEVKKLINNVNNKVDNDTLVEKDIPKKVESPKIKGDKKKRGGYTTATPGKIDPAYAHVYAHKEDYLLDYYSLSSNEVASKWKLQDRISVRNRATACRLMLTREGFDMAYFDELSKEHKSDLLRKRLKK